MKMNISDPLGGGNSLEELEAELARAETARDALLKEVAEYRRAFEIARDHAGVSVWTIDLRSGTIGIGTESCDLPLDEHLHPDDRDVLVQNASRLRPDQPDIRMKLRMKRSEGRWEWFRFDGFADQFGFDGRPLLLVGAGKNIIDEIIWEQNLAEDERLLDELLDNSVALLYRYDSGQSEIRYLNAPVKEHAIPDYTGTFEKMIEDGLKTVHPDDRDRIDAALGQIVANLKGNSATKALEYRRADLQGAYHWYYDVMTFIPDRINNVQTMLGSAIDITAFKEAEAMLRASEERYRLVTTLSSFLIWTTDLEMNFLYCSPAVYNMLGYTSEEIIALGPRKTLLPESFRVVARLAQEIRSQEAKQPDSFIPRCVHLWQRHKDGRAVLTEVAVSVIRDDARRLAGFCGVTRDITEFHQMREALRTSREMLENRVLERTAELLRANEYLRQEIERRRQVEMALLEMSEAEQRSIGHDLHDGLCQQLAGVMCLCEAARERFLEIRSIDAIQMGRIHDLLAGAVRYARSMARGLSPLFIDANGLSDSLEALAASSPIMFRVACSFSRMGKGRVEEPEQALNLYRIARMAVQNAVHDGNAAHIDILLKTTAKSVSLIVSDDGAPRATSIAPSDYGHCMIDYRMRIMSGNVVVKDRPGGGTVVRCVAPLRRPEKGNEDAAKD